MYLQTYWCTYQQIMITCTGSFISLQDIDVHFVFVQNVYTMYKLYRPN